jgi:hypothetical protein
MAPIGNAIRMSKKADGSPRLPLKLLSEKILNYLSKVTRFLMLYFLLCRTFKAIP